jgi:hypothetical protein
MIREQIEKPIFSRHQRLKPTEHSHGITPESGCCSCHIIVT